MNEPLPQLNARARSLIKSGRHDQALHLLTGPVSDIQNQEPKPRGYADMLSMFGFTMCMVQRKRKDAVDLCRQAVDLDRLNPRLYFLLGRVYLEASSRKLAYETFQSGLRVDPSYRPLVQALVGMGVRKRPVVGFLHRDNMINVGLGKIMHAIKPRKK